MTPRRTRPAKFASRRACVLPAGIELTGTDQNGENWGATIFGPNTADPVTKVGDAARVQKLGRDAMAEIARTGRTEDHVAALGELQRTLDAHYRGQ